jgi:malonate transporter
VGIAGPLLDVVLPVYGLIAVGWGASRTGRIDADDVRRLSRLTFGLFSPALLFRAMARTDFGTLQPRLLLAYFTAAFLVFGLVAAVGWRRGSPLKAAVTGLAASYSNTVMIGIPLVSVGWGEPGLTLLLSIIALHSLLLLTAATLLSETAVAGGAPLQAAARALRPALLSPVTLPIVIGAAWSALGLPLPRWADTTIGLLGAAAVPLSLVLLGATLHGEGMRATLRPGLALTALKLLVLPLVAWGIGSAFGLPPLALSIAVLTAALPIGSNVFLFSQRYQVHTAAISATVFWSTLLAAPLYAVLLPLLPVPPR